MFDTEANRSSQAPLAELLRPQTTAEFVGQQHLLASDKPLGMLAKQRKITSMILWGPPGTGKTTLARILANNADAEFISLSAVLSGVKDVRDAVAQAQMHRLSGRQTILFVDEVHRFNKAQQDAFLPHVEDGTIHFIGATTENPSFEVNKALLSRARVFVLKPFTSSDLELLVERATKLTERSIESDAKALLIDAADGDGRRLLNIFDLSSQLVDSTINLASVQSALGERIRRFDKGGELFYDQISALHKSIRGSDPNGAIYWFSRMLDGGADPRYLGRRLLRMASEDIGNADPRALQICVAALDTFERLGSPEGELALAQAALYLASVPKSDAAYSAFNQAMAYVKETPSFEVPMHLRNAPSAMMKSMGYGEAYRHAHNEQTSEGAFAAGETYLPAEVSEDFYQPTDQGLEAKIKQRLARLKHLNDEAQTGE